MDMRIDHYVHDERADRIVGMLEEVLTRLQGIKMQEQVSKRTENEIMATVKEVKAQADKALAAIAANGSKDDSIIALVTANTAQIASLRQQLADAIANGADPAELQAVLDALTAAETSALSNAQRVTDAVNANTPTDPPPPAL